MNWSEKGISLIRLDTSWEKAKMYDKDSDSININPIIINKAS